MKRIKYTFMLIENKILIQGLDFPKDTATFGHFAGTIKCDEESARMAQHFMQTAIDCYVRSRPAPVISIVSNGEELN